MIPRKTIQLAAAFLAVMPFLFCATPGASGQIPHNDEFVHHSAGTNARRSAISIRWSQYRVVRLGELWCLRSYGYTLSKPS